MWKFVFMIPFCCISRSHCSNCLNTITSNSPAGSTSLLFQASSTTNIYWQYKCPSYELNANYSVYWILPKSGRHLVISCRQTTAEGRLKCSRHDASLSGFAYVIPQDVTNGIYLNVSVTNIATGYDSSFWELRKNGGENSSIQYTSQRIELCTFCMLALLANEFVVPTTDMEKCMSSYTGNCIRYDGFENNKYIWNFTITCVNRQWSKQIRCHKSCSKPSIPQLLPIDTATILQKYKMGYKVSMKCSEGKMYHITNPTGFISHFNFTCIDENQWSPVEISCWQGQVVDFVEKKVDLTSGHPTIFTCSARDQLSAQIVVGSATTNGKTSAWTNITITPDHDRIAVVCKEIDKFGRNVYAHSTVLDVTYKPELTSEIPSSYSFTQGTSHFINVPFRANPPLMLRNVSVTKAGENIDNFYLKVSQSKHSLVIHFVSVESSDFGEYNIEIDSSNPRSQLAINISVVEGSSWAILTPGDISSIALGFILLIVLILTVILWTKKSKTPIETTAKNNTTESEFRKKVISDPIQKSDSNTLTYEDMRGKANTIKSVNNNTLVSSTIALEKRSGTNQNSYVTQPRRSPVAPPITNRPVPQRPLPAIGDSPQSPPQRLPNSTQSAFPQRPRPNSLAPPSRQSNDIRTNGDDYDLYLTENTSSHRRASAVPLRQLQEGRPPSDDSFDEVSDDDHVYQ